MACRALCSAVVVTILALSSRARAQVNTEALRADLDTRTRYLAIQASLSGYTGNSNGLVGSGAAFAGARFGPHLVILKLQGDYAEFSGTATITKAFGHARYNLHLVPVLWLEVFSQIEENRFQRLALRQIDGAGVRLGVVQSRPFRLFYGTAWMLDYEKLDGTYVFGEGPSWFAQRWSNYLAAAWRATTRVRVSNTLYVQPRFNGFRDVRVLNDAALVIDIDKRFSAKVACDFHYNSTPPLGVLPIDVETTTSLVLTL